MKGFKLYVLVVMSMFLLSACSQKSVEVNEDNNVSESEASLNKVKVEEESIVKEVKEAIDNSNDVNATGNFFLVKNEKKNIETVYFDFNKYILNEDQRSVAQKNSTKLDGYTGKIKIEGNCDEWGTDEYNYALGLKRAKSVKDALIADGINTDIISVVSYGESNPVCTAKNKECWNKNRRSEYRPLP